MPQLRTHIYFGLFTYPLAYFLVGLIFMKAKWSHFSMPFDDLTIVLSYFVYVIGSDLPDIDSKTAPIHHFLKILASILGVFMLLSWGSNFLSEKFGDIYLHLIATSVFVLAGGLISYILITLVLKLRIFDHRGFAHSISFAVIYGLLIYIGFYKSASNSLFIALLGTAGVILHLILDTVEDVKKGNKKKALKLW